LGWGKNPIIKGRILAGNTPYPSKLLWAGEATWRRAGVRCKKR